MSSWPSAEERQITRPSLLTGKSESDERIWGVADSSELPGRGVMPKWQRSSVVRGVVVLGALAVWVFVWGPSTCTRFGLKATKLEAPKRPPTRSIPTRPLEWGDVNFLHTTDSHGWLLGHQKETAPEPNGSGTFGDFYSFATHMKQKAEEQGVDLLLVDSGDHHDGNGLSDGFPAGQVNGHETNKFFAQMPYDVLAIGNHELYKYNVAEDVYKNFAPKWKGRYLTSNVNITTSDSSGNLVTVPIGDRFTKFTTARGRKVTAFGILFDFKNNAANTHIQGAEDLVKETWFKEAIAEEPDFFLLVGHMPVAKDNWPTVFRAIRSVHPLTPVFIFGGHLHIRDCVVLDGRSMALASGRYMETVGWMSATLEPRTDKNLTLSRRYLDANRLTYQFHTKTTPETFDTSKGIEITQGLLNLADRWNLSTVFGVAPQNYYLDRYPANSTKSVVGLFINEVLPTVLENSNPERANVPYIVIANSGAQRFDLFKGPFTHNDQFIISPFTNSFSYLSVPYGIAKLVADKLNAYGAFSTLPSTDGRWGSALSLEDAEAEAERVSGSGSIDKRWARWRKDQWEMYQTERELLRAAESSIQEEDLTLGYRTKDSCPGENPDDTPHAPPPYYSPPGYVSYNSVPVGIADQSHVDVIFLDFFAHDVVKAVNEISAERQGDHQRGGATQPPYFANVTIDDLKTYGNAKSNEVFGEYAKKQWN